MTLAEQLFFMMQENAKATQPTDLVIGTVETVSPLSIRISMSMDALRSEVLYLTESVVEKKIPILEHKHQTTGLQHSHTIDTLSHTHVVNGATTSAGLSDSYQTGEAMEGGSFPSSTELMDIHAVEHGEQLPVENGYIILNRGLAVGDKVLLLRVQHGQKFIVLSRIFEQ